MNHSHRRKFRHMRWLKVDAENLLDIRYLRFWVYLGPSKMKECKNTNRLKNRMKSEWKLNRFSKKYNEEKKHTSLRSTFHLPFRTLNLVLTCIDLLPCSCIWPVWPMFYTSQRSYCRYLLICFNQGVSMMTRHNNETDIYTNIVHIFELHFYCIMIIIFQRWNYRWFWTRLNLAATYSSH